MGVAVRMVGSGRWRVLDGRVAVLVGGWVVGDVVGNVAVGRDVGKGWVTVQPASNKIKLKTKKMGTCFMENFLN